MPTKRNKAGNQQNYVPAGHGDASGEYGDNASGSNKHIQFTNFKKPDGDNVGVKIETKPRGESYQKLAEQISNYANLETKEIEKELNSGFKYYQITKQMEELNDGGKITDEEFEELYERLNKAKDNLENRNREEWGNYYKGKGNETLINTLSNKLVGSSGKVTPNGKKLINQLNGANDELSGVIADYYRQNRGTTIKLGKNLNSSYRTTYTFFGGVIERSILLGEESLEGGQSSNYSKGGVFFHESGHALNHTYEGGKQWSENYKSTKYGKSLSEMIEEEMKQNVNFDELKKEFVEAKESYKTPEYDDMLKRIETLDNEQKEVGKNILNSPKINEITQKLDVARKNKVDSWKKKDFEGMKKYQEEIDFLQNSFSMEYENSLPKDYKPKQKELKDLRDEVYNRRYKAYGEANVKYGDISDMCQASLGKRIGMGHKENYFSDKENIGDEAFAEIMSAKATNPNSLSIMQRYIPKTLEIFDEIILRIKKGR